MTFNKWTNGLIAAGVVSLGSVALADESPISTLVSGTTIGGAVDTSAQLKAGSGDAMAYRFINTAPDHYNGFNLDFFELRIEKPLDEQQWSAGYKAELWLGQDANGLPGLLSNGVALKQAYVALRAPVGNGLDFKIGQFDTIIGYEVASSYANPNFSRSLGYALEPISHTGVTASYQLTEWLGVTGGVADSAYGGLGVRPHNAGELKGNGTLTYLGSLTVKAPESLGVLAGSSLYAGIIDGGLSPETDTLNYYVGASLPTPIKELTVGVAWDYVTNYGARGNWGQSIAGYASYQLTEKMKLNGRVEYGNSNYEAWGVTADRLFAVTTTLEYALWANVVSRLEAIWDHDLRSDDSFNGKNNAVLFVAEVAYKF